MEEDFFVFRDEIDHRSLDVLDCALSYSIYRNLRVTYVLSFRQYCSCLHNSFFVTFSFGKYWVWTRVFWSYFAVIAVYLCRLRVVVLALTYWVVSCIEASIYVTNTAVELV